MSRYDGEVPDDFRLDMGAPWLNLLATRGRHFGPRPERVRELGQLAAASTLPARAALLRWGALPGAVRSRLLTAWYGSQRTSSAA